MTFQLFAPSAILILASLGSSFTLAGEPMKAAIPQATASQSVSSPVAGESPAPALPPSASAAPAAIAPIAAPATSDILSPGDKKKLPSEFKKAQSNEEKAFDHQEKAALKELNASQSAALKAWRLQERNERRTYFDQHLSGPDRRQFVQGYLSRKKAFDQNQKDDLALAKRTWREKREALKSLQKDRELQFKTALNQDKIPNANLWPNGH